MSNSKDGIFCSFCSDNPAIRTVQSTVVVEAGQRADLEVYVSTNNGRSATIAWHKSNQIATSNLFHSSTRLTFENVRLSDAGVYSITVSILGTGFIVLTDEAFITLTVYGECLIINTTNTCKYYKYQLNNSRTQDIFQTKTLIDNICTKNVWMKL